MRISDWSSDVCSSDLALGALALQLAGAANGGGLFAGALFRGLLIVTAQLHLAIHALALQLLLEREQEIGRASCRERVCQYVKMLVVAVSLKKKEDRMWID